MYASNKQKTIKTEVLNNGKMFLKKQWQDGKKGIGPRRTK
jgi:hypothetical protein